MGGGQARENLHLRDYKDTKTPVLCAQEPQDRRSANHRRCVQWCVSMSPSGRRQTAGKLFVSSLPGYVRIHDSPHP